MGNFNSTPCGEDEIEIKKDPEHRYSIWGNPAIYFESLKLMKSQLKFGDIISVRSGFVDHYLVNINQVYCVHFYAVGEDGKKKSDVKSVLDYLGEQIEIWPRKWGDQPGKIVLETLESAIGDRPCCIDNRVDHAIGFGIRTRRKGEKILEEAQKVLQSPAPKYNIGNFNCETFALELRYGAKIPSEQFYPSFAPNPIHTLVNFGPIYGLIYLIDEKSRNPMTGIISFLCLTLVESVKRKIGVKSSGISSQQSYYWTSLVYYTRNLIINLICVYALCILERESRGWTRARYTFGFFYSFEVLSNIGRVSRDPNITKIYNWFKSIFTKKKKIN